MLVGAGVLFGGWAFLRSWVSYDEHEARAIVAGEHPSQQPAPAQDPAPTLTPANASVPEAPPVVGYLDTAKGPWQLDFACLAYAPAFTGQLCR